ncbi:unnamed protein product [Colias eurytheme]|nr:unnamed protein product [Colias eurytheme]
MTSMESLKQSMVDLTITFNKRMADFQKKMENPAPASTDTSTQIAAEFNLFRAFVTTSLECLQSQLDILMKLYDQQETRSRRKMLLIHGVPEKSQENPSLLVCDLLSKHFKLPNLSEESISRCHRLGRMQESKPRPIVLKLNDVKLRDKVWLNKVCLKGTGITLSEFLTKQRHNAFMSARKRFGIDKCWTRDGCIFIIGPNGSRYRATCIADVDTIPAPVAACSTSSLPVSGDNLNDDKIVGSRPKRLHKVK